MIKISLDYKEVPKIELHCHLDGSLRVETIIDLVKEENLFDILDIDPSSSIDFFRQISTAPKNSNSLLDYLKAFDIPVAILQSEKNLERATYELMEDASKENIKYIEIRFAPLLHTKNGLSVKQIISSVLSGIYKAEEKFNIKGNIILGCMRNMSEEDAVSVIEAGKEFLSSGVVALDLCGPEEDGFCEKYIGAFNLAKKYGYKKTVHAGEAATGKNILDAVELLGADRVGHGVRLRENSEAYRLVKEKNTALEMCPTSNIQTKAVKSLKDHPFYEYYRDGINVTINTDNRTVSGVSLSEELETIFKAFDLNKSDYIKIYKETVNVCFASENTKNWLLELI